MDGPGISKNVGSRAIIEKVIKYRDTHAHTNTHTRTQAHEIVFIVYILILNQINMFPFKISEKLQLY